jgi:uncharacterized membrane protein
MLSPYSSIHQPVYDNTFGKPFHQSECNWREFAKLGNQNKIVGKNVQKPITIPRLHSLDVARGLALLAMATYHFSWDLELFGYVSSGTASSGFLKYYARAIASSFLFMAGFSLVLATINGVKWPLFLKRLAMVGGAAFIISLATYFAVPDGWIFFGILHHIALASLIGLLFLRLHWVLVLLAALFAFALPFFDVIATASPWLVFVGLFATPPNSNDFVPLFPWLSASLAGIAVAKLVLANDWLDILTLPKAIDAPTRPLKFLGQHSLVFYLVHQPILIGLLWLATQIVPPAPNAVGAEFQLECKQVCEQQFNEKQCQTYCACFEIEMTDNAAQWSQLPAQDQTRMISNKCTIVMQANQ